MPQSVLDEGAHAEHLKTVAAAERSEHVHARTSLKKVVPTAAALAVGAVQAAHAQAPPKNSGPAHHQDVKELAHDANSR